MAAKKSPRSRKAAPRAAGTSSALELAKRAVPPHLHAHAKVVAPAQVPGRARKGEPRALADELLERHAATLRAAAPGDADVLFHDRRSTVPRSLVVQVRAGRVARVLIRA